MSDTPQLDDVLSRLHRALTGLGLKYALIGGLAVVLRGYGRSTRDVDAVVLDADDLLPKVLAGLREQGLVLRQQDGLEFARRHRVILLRSEDGTEVDLSMGALPFELELVQRSCVEPAGPGISVPVATAEDLVIMKLIASRPQDREDVRRLLELYQDLDRRRIRGIVSEYAELLEQPEIVEFMNTALG